MKDQSSEIETWHFTRWLLKPSLSKGKNFLLLLKLLISDCFQVTFIYIILWTEDCGQLHLQEKQALVRTAPWRWNAFSPTTRYLSTVSNSPAIHKILHQNHPQHWFACSHYFVFDVRTDWASIINLVINTFSVSTFTLLLKEICFNLGNQLLLPLKKNSDVVSCLSH